MGILFPSTGPISGQQASGGSYYRSPTSGYMVHVFTSSGVLTTFNTFTAQYLVVGGGGSAGAPGFGGNTNTLQQGGGGAGGMRTGCVTLSAKTSYTIQVGGGGIGVPARAPFGTYSQGGPGSWSSFSGPDISTVVSCGGGGGGKLSGSPGASGGGAGAQGASSYSPSNNVLWNGGCGIPGQGNPGGRTYKAGYTGAGGGGAVSAGGDSGTGPGGPAYYAGAGGTGGYFFHTNSRYAGGGGGATAGGISYAGGGGCGGGGMGSYTIPSPGYAAVPGSPGGFATGGGGGGGALNGPGGAGGPGVVVIAYAYNAPSTAFITSFTTTTQQAGIVTTSGGITIALTSASILYNYVNGYWDNTLSKYVGGRWSMKPFNTSTADVSVSAFSNQFNTATSAFAVSAGCSAQRPVVGYAGAVRYNTSLNVMETYSTASGTWFSLPVASYTIEYFVVGAGGAGSATAGGGSGGVLAGFAQVSTGNSYTISVGQGGPGSGGNSYIAVSTISTSSSTAVAYAYGGSAGTTSGGSSGAGYVGQGYPASSTVGAGATGSTGAGIYSSITGTSSIYAAGGTASGGTPGGTNTGNGGSAPGGTGSPGVIHIRYPGSQKGTGGAVSTVGTYTLHAFTSTGIYIA
jgi:hypothetical protein